MDEEAFLFIIDGDEKILLDDFEYGEIVDNVNLYVTVSQNLKFYVKGPGKITLIGYLIGDKNEEIEKERIGKNEDK